MAEQNHVRLCPCDMVGALFTLDTSATTAMHRFYDIDIALLGVQTHIAIDCTSIYRSYAQSTIPD